MNPIHVIPLATPGADPGFDALEQLAAALARAFRTPCQIRPEAFDLSGALDAERNQYSSAAILQQLERRSAPGARVLGVTAGDLYAPALTFVFGEAQLEGTCAVVSTARLKDEFYGLPPREDLLRERLLKEATHQLGHTFGLRHCADWRCVMAASFAVERLDVRGAEFCAACGKHVRGKSDVRPRAASRARRNVYL